MPVRIESPQTLWKIVAKQTLKVVGIAVANVAPIIYLSQTTKDPPKDVPKAIAEHSIGGTR